MGSAASADMDPRRPHPVTVVGRSLVLWRDAAGEWRCFADECPHRLVPLSEVGATAAEPATAVTQPAMARRGLDDGGGENPSQPTDGADCRCTTMQGRIDDAGRLQCSYHGWAFGPSGACEHIPQDGPEGRACASSRACATAFPVAIRQASPGDAAHHGDARHRHQAEGSPLVPGPGARRCGQHSVRWCVQGIMFVWPNSGGWERAAAVAPPVVPECDDTATWRVSGLARDLPYGYEVLVENIVDPSHLPFAHHGVGDLKRKDGKPLILLVEPRGLSGFFGTSDEAVMMSKNGIKLEFQAPNRATYFSVRERKGKEFRMMTTIFCTPTTPGRSRIVLTSALEKKSRSLFRFFPNFLLHLFQQKVLDGDAFFLHGQERTMERLAPQSHKAWSRLYFFPTSADRFVLAFRQWLMRHAGGGVQWPDGIDTQLPTQFLSKEETLNRWNDHTRHCLTCQTALRRLQAVQHALRAVAAILLAAAALGAPAAIAVRGALATAALASYLAAAAIEHFNHGFTYLGYDHATT
eukprot:SM000036S13266  [mRNA]  locus=s36:245418:247515:- [translate_table: standard]